MTFSRSALRHMLRHAATFLGLVTVTAALAQDVALLNTRVLKLMLISSKEAWCIASSHIRID